MASRISQPLAEESANLGDYLIDGDGGEALFAFDDAGLEAATPAIGLVIEDAMLFAVGEPDTRLVAGSEDRNARGLHCGGEMHGAAVMSDKYAGMCEGGGTLARGEDTTEIDDGAAGVFPPAIGGELAGLALFQGSA
jgi:hypothetical protein